MAERLTPVTLDLEVRGSSLARRVLSLDKELTPLCLSSPSCIDGCDGLESRPGGSSNTPRHGSCYGNRYKLQPCGPLARVRLYLYYLPQIPVI